ncbi:hypothetical protein TNCV_4361161 [Trichonephila clavipes]|nr:hypothetical protein TNCV_4361161 [Trichonephila clavipes]
MFRVHRPPLHGGSHRRRSTISVDGYKAQRKCQRYLQVVGTVAKVQPLTPIVQFTGNIFDITCHPLWSCPLSPCS